MNPGIQRKWGGRDAIVGAVLFAAMVLLAVLQYRWIGQVSEADRDRLQRGLRGAVNRFTDDFNGDVERLAQILSGGGQPGAAEQSIEARVQLWRGLVQNPQIVKAVWESGAADLPDYLWKLRARLPENVNGLRGGGRGGRTPINVDGSVPALAVPQLRAGDDPGTLRWSIIEFDRDHIQKTWLPELVARDFGADYRVQILMGRDTVLYDNDPGMDPEEGVTASLFALRQGPFGRGGRGGGPPDGKDGKDGKGPDFGKGDFGKGDFGNKQGKRGGFNDDSGWRVEATFKSGTTNEVVESLRLRNLGVSFGILLLMGASVAMLIRSTRQANALALQQMEFVAGVTHELRTPLAVILSASQNLADGVATGEAQAKRYGGVIHSQTKRLGDMVEQVLRFAGLSSQHGELQRAAVPVGPLVQEALLDCRAELAATGTEVSEDLPADLPEIDGDRAALLHCLRNLFSNAAKHGAGAPVKIAARCTVDQIEITVEDRGPGIDPTDLPHIFEPFYRGSRAKEDQVKGSGLGLSLVKKIVEAHGGTVNVSSRLGNGATFRILLPMAKG